MSKIAFIQLARMGDICSALPMMLAKAQAGHEVSCYVHEHFAPMLDGVGYVKPIIWPGMHRDVQRCVEDAKRRGFDEIISTQLDGNELAKGIPAKNFHHRQWLMGGMWDKFHDLPLIFDRRNPLEEKRELDAYLPADDGKPLLVYALHGHSSPFYKWQEFEKWLRGAAGSHYRLLDIGRLNLAKPYHLLAFMEKAAVLVSAATLHVPLAYACGIPTICLCCDTDPNGNVERREFFWPEPRKHWLGHMSYSESLTPQGRARISQWMLKPLGRTATIGRYVEPAQGPLPPRVPFHDNPQPSHASITLAVPQGIGDIIWVYQKFAPYFSRINFRVLSTNDDAVQRRALPWLRLLPKVGNIDFAVDTPSRVMNLIRKPCTMRDAFEQWSKRPNDVIDYCCNVWLERGVRLDEIDLSAAVQTDVELAEQSFALPYGQYAVAYISGDTRHDNLHRLPSHAVWNVDEWAEYLRLVWGRFDLNLPIVVIGAKFDEPISMKLRDKLLADGFECSTLIGAEPAKVVHLLKNAEAFFGYQSGLNIVADLCGVKRQFMAYFPYLKDMHYTWCKPQNIKTTFFADTFMSTPEHAATRHPLFAESLAMV